MHPVYGLHIRLQRAYEHFEALNTEVDSFLRTSPCTFIREHQAEDGRQIFRAKILHEPPLRLSLLLADCVNNLRSTLDNMWCQILVAYGHKREATKSNFPICITEAQWLAVRASLPKLPVELLDALQLIQPYFGLQRGQLQHITENRFALLHSLWNREKHRELTNLRFRIMSAESDTADYRLDLYPVVSKDGAIVLQAFPLVVHPEPSFDVAFGVDIVIGPRPRTMERGVRETLAMTHETLRKLLLVLETHFALLA